MGLIESRICPFCGGTCKSFKFRRQVVIVVVFDTAHGQATYPVAILPFLDELPNNSLRDIPT